MKTLPQKTENDNGLESLLCELLFAISEGRPAAAALLASSVARLVSRGAIVNPILTAGRYMLTTGEGELCQA